MTFYEECPCCGAELFIHEEEFGRRVVQVQPSRCENCGWTEDLGLKISQFVKTADLKHHELKYVKRRGQIGLDLFFDTIAG